MRRLSRAFWPVLVGALLPFVFSNQPWAGWPGDFVLRAVGVKPGMADASDSTTVAVFVLFVLINAAVWGGLLYLLTRLAVGRWLAERT
jgi:hypothetical protein